MMMDGRAKLQIKTIQSDFSYFKSYSSHSINSENDRTFILHGIMFTVKNFKEKHREMPLESSWFLSSTILPRFHVPPRALAAP